MKIGFDLDGVLERPVMRELLLRLREAGVEIHIITGSFDEVIWQSADAKRAKLDRLKIPFTEWPAVPGPQLHIIHGVDRSFDIEYRLRDIGLRKGLLTEELGIDIMIDDSTLYCDVMPVMNGALTVLQVR